MRPRLPVTTPDLPSPGVEVTKRRILFVSIAFPPKFDSESLQVEKIFSELVERNAFGFSVVTSEKHSTRNLPLSPDMECFETLVDEYLEIKVPENKYINKALSICGLVNFPDTKWMFHRQGLGQVLGSASTPDIIYSRSFPPSSNILACKVARRLDVPWIMHLSDPWFLSPLAAYSWLERRYNARWERACLKTAARVSFTTANTLDLYARHYPEFRSKFFLTYNSVRKAEAVSEPDVPASEQVVIVHTGVLNRQRDPSVFFEALREFRSRFPALSDKICVKFCGAADAYAKGLYKDNSDLAEYLGVVSKAEKDDILSTADFLLAFDFSFNRAEDSVFLLSKLLDYAAVGKRITCITNKGSPAETFVGEVGGICFGRENPEPLVEFFGRAIEEKCERNVRFFHPQPLPDRYLTSSVVDRLISEIRSVIGDDGLVDGISARVSESPAEPDVSVKSAQGAEEPCVR